MRSYSSQQILLKFDSTLSRAQQGVLSTSSRDQELLAASEGGFKRTNGAAAGHSQSRDRPGEGLSSAREERDFKGALQLRLTGPIGDGKTSWRLGYSQMPGQVPEVHCFQIPYLFQDDFI